MASGAAERRGPAGGRDSGAGRGAGRWTRGSRRLRRRLRRQALVSPSHPAAPPDLQRGRRARRPARPGRSSSWPTTTPPTRGLVFHPALPRVAMERMPKLHERADQSIPIIFGVFLGPVLLALWGLTGRRAAARRSARSSRAARSRRWRTSAAATSYRRQRQPQCGRRGGGAGALAGREPAARRARGARLDRLGGVVHGGHAGLRAAPLRVAAARDDGVRVHRVRRLTAAVRGRGGGHAAHAPLHGELARRARRGRGTPPASRCAAACARWPPRTP